MVQGADGPADGTIMDSEQRTDVPCDSQHLNVLRAPDSDIAVPSNPAALESIAALLAHRSHRAA